MIDFIRCATCSDDSSKLVRIGGKEFCARCARCALDAVCPPMAPRAKPTDDDVLEAVGAGFKTMDVARKLGVGSNWLGATYKRLTAAGRMRHDARRGRWVVNSSQMSHAL